VANNSSEKAQNKLKKRIIGFHTYQWQAEILIKIKQQYWKQLKHNLAQHNRVHNIKSKLQQVKHNLVQLLRKAAITKASQYNTL
jgi:hypothetical protein